MERNDSQISRESAAPAARNPPPSQRQPQETHFDRAAPQHARQEDRRQDGLGVFRFEEGTAGSRPPLPPPAQSRASPKLFGGVPLDAAAGPSLANHGLLQPIPGSFQAAIRRFEGLSASPFEGLFSGEVPTAQNTVRSLFPGTSSEPVAMRSEPQQPLSRINTKHRGAGAGDLESESDESPTNSPNRGGAPADPGTMVIDAPGAADLDLVQRPVLTELYSVCMDASAENLRKAVGRWKSLKSGRTKVIMASKLLLEFMLQMGEGKSAEEVLAESRHLGTLADFREKAATTSSLWKDPPSKDDLLQKLDSRERQKFISRFAGVQRGEQQAQDFSIDEFARLMVLLRDDERTRSAVHKATGGTMNRLEQEYGANRDSWWTIAANRFNDEHVDSVESFAGRLDGVNSNKRPPVLRTATTLKEQFGKGRTAFTLPKSNFERSGQNNPENFVGFLRCQNNGALTMDSKRAYVIFCVSRLGTEGRDDRFLDLMTKTTAGGFDEGMPSIGAIAIDSGDSNFSSLPSSSGRKRRRSSGEQGEDVASAFNNIGNAFIDFVQVSNSKIRQMEEMHAKNLQLRDLQIKAAQNKESDGQAQGVYLLQRAEEQMKLLQLAATRLAEAEQTKAENPTFHKLCQDHYDFVLGQCQQLMRPPQQ